AAIRRSEPEHLPVKRKLFGSYAHYFGLRQKNQSGPAHLCYRGIGGHEPTLGKGVVSNSRPHGGSQYMHISATISPGFSGGGLVDDQGRLIGILSLQSVEHQNHTFAQPVEWVGELAKRTQPLQTVTNKDGLNWLNRTMALEQKPDWQALLKLSQQETKHDPANAAAWYGVGVASAHLKQYNQAVRAYREAIRNQAEYAEAWHKLGVAYANLKEYDHAIHAYRDALRIQRDNADGWYDLGNTHYELKQYAHAVHSYREALRIQSENADAWYKLGVAYARVGECGKTRGIYQALRKLDPARADVTSIRIFCLNTL
ncbi:MAG: tetratricopeptide repeat-containing serine protease family protein, partial [Nitrosospira sp.]